MADCAHILGTFCLRVFLGSGIPLVVRSRVCLFSACSTALNTNHKREDITIQLLFMVLNKQTYKE